MIKDEYKEIYDQLSPSDDLVENTKIQMKKTYYPHLKKII